jgi:predicted nucleotidyltransferase
MINREVLPTLDPALSQLVHLLQSYAPERIVLFGSRARGDADEYSDYDLIVIKRTQRSFLDRLQDMVPYLVAFEHKADILVYTPEEFEQMRETGLGWIVQQEGIVLYERHST